MLASYLKSWGKDEMTENASDNAISLQALGHVKSLDFDSIQVGWLSKQGAYSSSYSEII